MDRKTWIQEKNSAVEISVKGNENEKLPSGKEVALEETVKNLHEQVACLICECNVKDKLVTEHAKAAQEANTGRENAEALVSIINQELEAIIQQQVNANERSVNLTDALKKCKRQLSSLKLEQNLRENLERAHKILESKYTKARKKLANLTIENARLAKALIKREGKMKNASNEASEATIEFDKLISKLDSTEKASNFLKYEYRLHADVAHRQQLEAERQKLRLLVRKRASGHQKIKPNNYHKAVERRMSLMVKQLWEVEEENKILKQNACKKENEIHLLKAELARIRCDQHNNGDFDTSMEKYAVVSVGAQSLKINNLDMEEKLLESEKKILSLKTKLESMKDNLENQKLINFDLDQQLSAAKVETKEALQEVSLLEIELEDKSNHYEGLEATCLDLQLQLNSVSNKDVVKDLEQEVKMQIKEILNITETKQPSVPCYDACNTSCKVVPRALPIVPSKKHGKVTVLLRRLLFRGKRGISKKKLHGFAVYKI